jgi:hypothetical protein
VLPVTPNADLYAALFNSPCASESASRFQHRLTARLRRPQNSHVIGNAPANWTIRREKSVFVEK